MLEDSCLELCLFTHDSNEHIDGLQSFMWRRVCMCFKPECVCVCEEKTECDWESAFHINVSGCSHRICLRTVQSTIWVYSMFHHIVNHTESFPEPLLCCDIVQFSPCLCKVYFKWMTPEFIQNTLFKPCLYKTPLPLLFAVVGQSLWKPPDILNLNS